MQNAKAVKIAKEAIKFTEKVNPKLLKWARSIGPGTFKNMKMRKLLEIYCRVVYASGFKYKTVEAYFPRITTAFYNFDPARLSRMTSVAPVLQVFRSRRKAECFLRGAQSILKEGLPAFKNRVLASPLTAFERLPGIGPITRHHFAKDTGVLDTAKPDIWLVHAAMICNANSVSEMVTYQSSILGESQHTIDVAIWTYAEAGHLGVRVNRSIKRKCRGKPCRSSNVRH